MTTTTTRTSSTQSPFITNGENFLVGQYNKSIGLLAEYSGAQNYWLYSDNYLAIQAFKNGTSFNATNQLQIEQNVSQTLQRYMNAIPDAKNQYMALTQDNFVFNASQNYVVAVVDGKDIRITLDNGTGGLAPTTYADIAFLEAIYYHDIGNNNQAISAFNDGANAYDGIGIKDSPFTGQYQTYKLALYEYAAHILGQSLPSSVQTNLLKMQGSDGGFYTGYTSTFSTDGTFENTETTSLAILALAS